MTLQTDPLRPAIVDANNSQSHALPLPEEANGFNDNQPLTNVKFNAVARAAGLFANWLDQNSPRIELELGAVTCRLSSTSLRYTAGAGLSQPVSTEGMYYIEGRLVQHTLARCTARGQSPHTFTALRDHHVWLKSDGSIRFQVVAIGAAAVGLAGEYYEGFVRTDATDVTQHIGPGDAFFAQGYHFDTPRVLSDAITMFRGDTLRLIKQSGSSVYLRFQEEADTPNGQSVADNGWHFEGYNASARRLRLVQRINASNYTIVDWGDVNTGTPIAVSVPVKISSAEDGSGDYALEVVSTNFVGKGSRFYTQRSAAATFEADGPGGVPAVLVPRSGGFTLGAANGSLQISNGATATDLEFKDNNGVTRYCVATRYGRKTGAGAIVTGLSAIAVGTLGASVNFDIVSGASYRVSMTVRLGRAAGSTRDANITCTVNGSTIIGGTHLVSMFQAGAASQLEHTFTTGEIIYTAGVTANVTASITITPINGAGNVNMALRSVYIEGPLDTA